jgi:hypothetical protein
MSELKFGGLQSHEKLRTRVARFEQTFQSTVTQLPLKIVIFGNGDSDVSYR